MLNQELTRIFDLARRSGDRLIVTDTNGKRPVVVMDLASYEQLLDRQAAPFGPQEKQENKQEEANVQSAVEHDLRVMEAWEKESGEEEKQAVNPSDDRFYLEPVE
jgi:hypothetical protein